MVASPPFPTSDGFPVAGGDLFVAELLGAHPPGGVGRGLEGGLPGRGAPLRLRSRCHCGKREERGEGS